MSADASPSQHEFVLTMFFFTSESTQLVLNVNGTRRSPWHMKLGFQREVVFSQVQYTDREASKVAKLIAILFFLKRVFRL